MVAMFLLHKETQIYVKSWNNTVFVCFLCNYFCDSGVCFAHAILLKGNFVDWQKIWPYWLMLQQIKRMAPWWIWFAFSKFSYFYFCTIDALCLCVWECSSVYWDLLLDWWCCQWEIMCALHEVVDILLATIIFCLHVNMSMCSCMIACSRKISNNLLTAVTPQLRASSYS